MIRRLALAAALSIAGAAAAQVPAREPATKGTTMTQHAAGTFEVKLQPLPEDEKVPGVKVLRMAVDKQWKGDLDGASKAEMMATNAGDKGSGGYVAVEQFTGTLKGRSGSFTLVHRGTMKKGVAGFDLLIDVVPDSATGQLAGLGGRLKISMADGKHSYDLEYTLPD
jgi:hypothetical protein